MSAGAAQPAALGPRDLLAALAVVVLLYFFLCYVGISRPVAAGGGVGSLAEAEGSRLQAASADASAASRQAPRTALVRWAANGWRTGRFEVGAIMACGCEVILSGYDRGRGGAMIDVNAVVLRPPGLQVAATIPQVLF